MLLSILVSTFIGLLEHIYKACISQDDSRKIIQMMIQTPKLARTMHTGYFFIN